jgi:xylulokinase
MAKLLGIDVGTSGCKVLLVDERGAILRQASAEYPLSTPRPGWSEQNPEDWWNGVVKCLQEIGESSPDAIGLTGQMHGAVFLDENDAVVRPAILWNDQRTVEECAEIDATFGPDNVKAVTCNPPLTGFQAPKLLWLRNHELSNYQKVRSVLLPKDYIRLRLTGQKFTEVSDASGIGLFDVPNRRWATDMMAALEIDPSLFPPCAESFVPTAETLAVAGLNAGIPVVGGGGDQAAAAVGTGAVVPGIVSVSLGTSGVVFTAIEGPEYDRSGAAHTFCHANGGWHAMGVMLSCAGALRWYRDTVQPGAAYDAISSEAATAPLGCDGLTFLPYLSGERTPHNDPHARGAWAGLTLAHGRQHLARSIFEGATFGLKEGFDALQKLGARADELRVNGGGSKSAFWLQMLADVFEVPCTTLAVDEGPAFGAALLAGVGAGVWPDVAAAAAAAVNKKGRVEPQSPDYSSAYAKYQSLYLATRAWNATNAT